MAITIYEEMTMTMTRMWSTIAMAALLALTACADGPSVPDDDPAQEEGYVFGLSEAELVSIYPIASEQHDLASWLAFNRGAFQCARYGDLCAMVGPQAAEDITRNALYAALAGDSREAILAEIDRATQLARDARLAEPEDSRYRASDVGSTVYACGNHRLRVETFKVNPVFGARYGEVNCRHQHDIGPGWGGNQSTEHMSAFVEIVGTSEDASAALFNVHSLTSPRVFPSSSETVRGECTGTHNTEVKSRAVSIN